ncbi:MAG: hypothetical protein ACOX4A_00225 [Saccharofermentanales bacterium]|jgi:hypothetical protein
MTYLSLASSLLTYFKKCFLADVIAQENQWVADAARLQESEEEKDDEEGGDSVIEF